MDLRNHFPALHHGGADLLRSPLLIDAPPAPNLIGYRQGSDAPPAYTTLPILPRFTGIVISITL